MCVNRARTALWGPGVAQRGYLLNLRVKVPPAQIPVWRRSYIRQPTGATLAAESPEVNVLRGGREPDRPTKEANNQKGRSESERTNRRNPPQREVGRWNLECQGLPAPARWPELVRKKLGSARTRLPAEVEGGNSG